MEENQQLQIFLKYISKNLYIDLTSFTPHFFFQLPEALFSKISPLASKSRQDVLFELCKDSSHEKYQTVDTKRFSAFISFARIKNLNIFNLS